MRDEQPPDKRLQDKPQLKLPTEREMQLADLCSAHSTVPFLTIITARGCQPVGNDSSTEGGIESELAKLINQDGLIDCRIDAVKEKLVLAYAAAGGPWEGVRERALREAMKFERKLQLGLYQVNIVHGQFESECQMHDWLAWL